MNNNDIQTTTSSFGSSEFKEFPVEHRNQNKSKSFPALLGRLIANIIVTALSVCITAVVVALTYKFIMWLF